MVSESPVGWPETPTGNAMRCSLASLNVGGRCNLMALVPLFQRHSSLVWMLQETGLVEPPHRTDFEAALGGSFRVVHNPVCKGRVGSGLAFLIPTSVPSLSLLPTGQWHLIDGPSSGRLSRIDLVFAPSKEARCSLTIVNVYAPVGRASPERASFYKETLPKVLRAVPNTRHLVVVGDFNNTEDDHLDRLGGALQPGRDTSLSCFQGMVLELGLSDVWRHRHPLAQHFTNHSNTRATLPDGSTGTVTVRTRLDRFYLSRGVAKLVVSAKLAPDDAMERYLRTSWGHTPCFVTIACSPHQRRRRGFRRPHPPPSAEVWRLGGSFDRVAAATKQALLQAEQAGRDPHEAFEAMTAAMVQALRKAQKRVAIIDATRRRALSKELQRLEAQLAAQRGLAGPERRAVRAKWAQARALLSDVKRQGRALARAHWERASARFLASRAMARAPVTALCRDDGTRLTSPADVADHLADFLEARAKATALDSAAQRALLLGFPELDQGVATGLERDFEEEEAAAAVKSLRSTAAAGPDAVRPVILKHLADVVVKPLLAVANHASATESCHPRSAAPPSRRCTRVVTARSQPTTGQLRSPALPTGRLTAWFRLAWSRQSPRWSTLTSVGSCLTDQQPKQCSGPRTFTTGSPTASTEMARPGQPSCLSIFLTPSGASPNSGWIS
eukprot:m.465346 g.465346  ORF g.465346 m.465346 type:complete len:672 (+) comp20361_c3_seq1:611-2626(+)